MSLSARSSMSSINLILYFGLRCRSVGPTYSRILAGQYSVVAVCSLFTRANTSSLPIRKLGSGPKSAIHRSAIESEVVLEHTFDWGSRGGDRVLARGMWHRLTARKTSRDKTRKTIIFCLVCLNHQVKSDLEAVLEGGLRLLRRWSPLTTKIAKSRGSEARVALNCHGEDSAFIGSPNNHILGRMGWCKPDKSYACWPLI